MGRSVRSVTVEFNAGTAKAVEDVEKFKTSVRGVGNASGDATTGIRAIGTELRLLKGNVLDNVRGVEVFLSSFPKLRAALISAFPVAGAVAFLGVAGSLVSKLDDFYKKMRDGQALTKAAFADLNAPLKLTNDELAVANDRLENDIAKLEGRHQNTLKLALDEARASADKLADSLSKDLDQLKKVLNENKTAWYEQLLGSTSDKGLRQELFGASGVGGFYGEIQGYIAKGGPNTDKDLTAAYGRMIAQLDQEIKTETEKVKPVIDTATGALLGYVSAADGKLIEELKGARANLSIQLASIGLQETNAGLTKKKEDLEAGNANSAAERPFDSKVAAINAEISGLQAKLEAAGKGEMAKAMAEAFGAAAKDIEEVNKALAKHNTALTADQIAELKALEVTKAKTEADQKWAESYANDTRAITERVAATNAVTAAIGKGYDSVKAASVESQLMQKLGADYNNPSRAADIAYLRAQYGEEYDAQHAQKTAESIQKLQQEITLERQLAQAQAQGAAAVRQAELAVRLRQIALENDAESAKKLMAAEIELAGLQQENKTQEEVAALNQKIEATQRLTEATLKGAAAVRAAQLANELEKIRREGDTPVPGLIGIGVRGLAAIKDAGTTYTDELAKFQVGLNPLAKIDEEIAKIEDAKNALGDTYASEVRLRDLENERLKILTEQTLALRTAKAGVDAFFIAMQEDGKSAAQIIYDGLNSVVDASASNLAKLTTGQYKHGEFGKSLKSVGGGMADQAIKSGLQLGLGKLGTLFGIDAKKGLPKPSGRMGDPIHVWADNGFGAGSAAGAAPEGSLESLNALPVNFNGMGLGQVAGSALKSAAGGIGAFFGHLFSGAAGSGGASDGDVTSSITFGGMMAEGGTVSPDKAYIVGDNGPEVLTGASGRIVSNAEMQREFGGGNAGDTIYNINAPGAELGAVNRIMRGLEARDRMVAASAVRAVHERNARRPQRG